MSRQAAEPELKPAELQQSGTTRSRTRVSSSIDRLPDDLRLQLDSKLTDNTNTFIELSAWLKDEGYEISKSAIGRYSRRTNLAAHRVAETIQKTQAIAQAVADNTTIDLTDDKGRRIIVPAKALGYAIIGSETKHAVGFGTL